MLRASAIGYDRHVLVNRLAEALDRRRARTRDLARRAHATRRRGLVIVPSILGTRLVDARGAVVWGTLHGLYGGGSLDAAVATAGLLDGFSVVPGLYVYDVFGRFVRFLERVAGYRLGADLRVVEYDWRGGIAEAASALAAVVDGVGTDVDLACISTGGLAARYLLAGDARRAARIRRVVYVGTPHAGTFSAFSYLVDGVRPAPLGRWFRGYELAALQTTWDALPRPGERIFVDELGRGLDLELHAEDTWLALGLDPVGTDVAARLQRARQTWQVLDAQRAGPESVAIGARHLPTLHRCTIVGGRRAVIPPCSPPKRGAADVYEPGDSSVSARSLLAASPDAAWFVTPSEHRALPADREVHHLVLEALLARRIERNGATS